MGQTISMHYRRMHCQAQLKIQPEEARPDKAPRPPAQQTPHPNNTPHTGIRQNDLLMDQDLFNLERKTLSAIPFVNNST
jgi:hypothetical protein